MKKLPDHTTRYFARNAYWSVVHYGNKGPWKHKTVQGVDLVVVYVPEDHVLTCIYEIDGKIINKTYEPCKSWAY